MSKVRPPVHVVVSICALSAYLVLHFWTAALLYGSVGMGMFLLLLLVPGAGDLSGAFLLIKAGNCLPPLLLAAAGCLLLLSALLEIRSSRC